MNKVITHIMNLKNFENAEYFIKKFRKPTILHTGIKGTHTN